MNFLDIGGGFPAPYDTSVQPFSELAKRINAELERLFSPEVNIIAEPGRFIVATACTAVAKIIGKVTGSITPFPALSLTTVTITWNPLKKARLKFAPYSAQPVTGWTLFR